MKQEEGVLNGNQLQRLGICAECRGELLHADGHWHEKRVPDHYMPVCCECRGGPCATGMKRTPKPLPQDVKAVLQVSAPPPVLTKETRRIMAKNLTKPTKISATMNCAGCNKRIDLGEIDIMEGTRKAVSAAWAAHIAEAHQKELDGSTPKATNGTKPAAKKATKKAPAKSTAPVALRKGAAKGTQGKSKSRRVA